MLAYLFIILAVVFRLVIPHITPHPWDFTPVGASLLFFGAYGSRRQLWVPVVLLAATDVYLTKVVYQYPFAWDHFISFAWYAVTVWLGTWLRDRDSRKVLGFALPLGLAASVTFFLASNFGVWAAYDMYPKTLAGLMACYVAGIPFYERRIIGDLAFTAVFFALPVLLSLRSHKVDRGAATA
jgi:hypothetical protein